jgi:hypothetical protein
MPQTPFDLAARWRQLREEIMAAIQNWRLQHPKATLQEMEAAGDARLAELRTRRLQDVALASQAADVSQARAQDRPKCPHCGTLVEPRGLRERQVTTHQGKTLRLRRNYMVSFQVRPGRAGMPGS